MNLFSDMPGQKMVSPTDYVASSAPANKKMQNNLSPDIAYFIRSMHGGGAEKAALHLLREFVNQGLRVDLVLARGEGSYMDQIPREVNIVDLGTQQVAMSFPKMIRYLRQKQPKALIASLHYPAEIALWARKLAGVNTKVIIIEQNTLSIEAKRSDQLSVRLSPLAAKFSYPLADKVVAVSKGVAVDLAKTTGIPLDKIDVIYNPVITDSLFQQAQEPIDHPWFKVGEPPVIIAVGRLHPQKNFANLIYAFSKVRQTVPARLMILGVGPKENRLRKIVQSLGLEDDVAMPGFCQNPYPYIAKSTVFALSSAWEGFGMVLVEAMALGIPIVSTACPSGPSEVLDEGKYGLLVPVGDSDAMAKALIKALAGNGKKDTSDWTKQFKAEVCARQFLKLLEMA